MKYAPLEQHLRAQNTHSVAMSFADIERVLDAKLPPSARRHRAWWSNNPSNSVATYAWLNAGYKSAKVDMTGERLVFERARQRAALSVAETAPTPYISGTTPSLYGRFRGMFKYAHGSDLCAPTGERWTASHD